MNAPLSNVMSVWPDWSSPALEPDASGTCWRRGDADGRRADNVKSKVLEEAAGDYEERSVAGTVERDCRRALVHDQ